MNKWRNGQKPSFISPTFCVKGLDSAGEAHVTAFDVRQFAADDERYVVQRTLEQLLMMSQFCSVVWLVYPDQGTAANTAFIGRLDKGLDALQLDCVGIVRVSVDQAVKIDTFAIYREPKRHCAPKRDLYLSHFPASRP